MDQFHQNGKWVPSEKEKLEIKKNIDNIVDISAQNIDNFESIQNATLIKN